MIWSKEESCEELSSVVNKHSNGSCSNRALNHWSIQFQMHPSPSSSAALVTKHTSFKLSRFQTPESKPPPTRSRDLTEGERKRKRKRKTRATVTVSVAEIHQETSHALPFKPLSASREPSDRNNDALNKTIPTHENWRFLSRSHSSSLQACMSMKVS